MDLHIFLAALSDALHDVDLEDSGKIPTLYWDSFHVRAALLGHSHYYGADSESSDREPHFNRHHFYSDSALVHALVSANWFGPIKLLQPHQAELLRLINRDFDLDKIGPAAISPERFLRDVGLPGLMEDELAGRLLPSEERTARIVNEQAGEAPKLFKIIQAISHVTWRSRLAAWLDVGVLDLDSAPYDYGELLQSDLFNTVESALERHRPDQREANNFADAVALCQLHHQVQSFKRGNTNLIPRFLSSSLYRTIIREEKLIDDFTYTFNGQKHNIFRDVEYFKLRATLIKPPSIDEDTESGRRTQLILEAKHHLIEVGAARTSVSSFVGKVSNIEQSTMKLLLELERYSFLEDVWLRSAASTRDVYSAMQRYVAAAKQLRESDEFRLEMEEKERVFIRDLQEASREYRRIGDNWIQLLDAAKKQQGMLSNKKNSSNISTESGIIRFGFTRGEEDRAVELISQMLSEHLEERTDAAAVILRLVSSEKLSDLIPLIPVAGVLWAFDMFSQLFALLSNVQPRDPYRLRVLAASAALKLNDPSFAWAQILTLEVDCRSVTTPVELAHNLVGLGYLYFHYRECLSSGSFRLNEKEDRNYFRKAVDLAKEAYSLEQEDRRVTSYAANNVLYYMVIAGDLFSADEKDEAATALLRYETDPDLWSYRYDDTLAVYYEWMASLNTPDRRHWLDFALEKIDGSLAGCNGLDPDVKKHKHKIMMARHRIWKA